MPDWERVGRLPVPVEEVAKVVESSGHTIHRFWNNLRMGFVVELPEMTSIQVDANGDICLTALPVLATGGVVS